MLTVKANNGERKEILRFQKLALDDLKNNLGKKKMKTLIPQVVRATYIGGLLVLCAGSIVVSGTSFDAEGFLSFLTALALVVEPIQVSPLTIYLTLLLYMSVPLFIFPVWQVTLSYFKINWINHLVLLLIKIISVD